MTAPDAVLDAICSQRDQIPLMLAIVSAMGLLLLFPLLLLESGTQGYVMAVIDAGLVLFCYVVFGSTYWYCTRRAMD